MVFFLGSWGHKLAEGDLRNKTITELSNFDQGETYG